MVGERWSLLIVRDLFDGPRRFSRLRADLPDLSPTLLARRLSDLAAAGVIEATTGGYALTPRGRELWPAVAGLARWGLPLVDRPVPGDNQPEHFDRIGTLFLVRPESLPPDGLVAELTLDAGSFTLVVAPGARRAEVVAGTAAAPDVRVRSTVGALTRLRQGRYSATELRQRGRLEMRGSARHRRAFLTMVSPET